MADPAADPAHRARKPSVRSCIVTRVKMAPEAMLRFVLGPDDTVVPDILRRLPGRGAWTVLSSAVVERAMQRQAFSRAFRKNVPVPSDLAAAVDGLLCQSLTEALALAQKAGALVAGATKIVEAYEKHGIICLVHAKEARPDGIRKLDQTLKVKDGAHLSCTPKVFCGLVEGEKLDAALGRDNLMHVAIKANSGSGLFVAGRAQRLARYRGLETAGDSGTVNG